MGIFNVIIPGELGVQLLVSEFLNKQNAEF
jgi:hypothetical protein